MSVISLAKVRQGRDQQKAAAQDLAANLVETATAYGRALIDEALFTTSRLPDPDPQLARAVEGFILRRGLRRLRGTWRDGMARETADTCFKVAAPLVREAYWAGLDERDPRFCSTKDGAVPLIRGMRR